MRLFLTLFFDNACRKAMSYIADDPRFSAVEDEREREELYEEFTEELERKEKVNY